MKFLDWGHWWIIRLADWSPGLVLILSGEECGAVWCWYKCSAGVKYYRVRGWWTKSKTVNGKWRIWFTGSRNFQENVLHTPWVNNLCSYVWVNSEWHYLQYNYIAVIKRVLLWVLHIQVSWLTYNELAMVIITFHLGQANFHSLLDTAEEKHCDILTHYIWDYGLSPTLYKGKCFLSPLSTICEAKSIKKISNWIPRSLKPSADETVTSLPWDNLVWTC